MTTEVYEVAADGHGIISFKPGKPIGHVAVGETGEGGFRLVQPDGTAWHLRCRAGDEPVGVAHVGYISREEVEVLQVPGGPALTCIELVPVD